MLKKNFPLILICTLATVLRFWDLTVESFWVDEGYSAIFIRRFNYWEMITGVGLDRMHPPLYYLLIEFWTKITSTSEFQFRAVSAFFGVATIPATYWLTYLLTKNKPAALGVAFISTLATPLIYYSQETRSYALLTFLVLIQAALFLKALAAEKYFHKWVALFILASVLGVYDHYSFWIVLGAEGTYTLIFYLRRHNWKKGVQMLTALFITAVSFLPWFVSFTYKVLQQGIDRLSWQDALSWNHVLKFFSSSFFVPEAAVIIQYALVIIFLMLNVLLYIKLAPEQKKRLIFIHLIILVTLVFFLVTKMWHPRYILYIISIFYILTAWFLVVFRLRFVAALIIMAMVLLSIPLLKKHYTVLQKEQWRQMVDYEKQIEQEYGTAGKAVICRKMGRFPWRYYYPQVETALYPFRFADDEKLIKRLRNSAWLFVVDEKQNEQCDLVKKTAKKYFAASEKVQYGELEAMFYVNPH